MNLNLILRTCISFFPFCFWKLFTSEVLTSFIRLQFPNYCVTPLTKHLLFEVACRTSVSEFLNVKVWKLPILLFWFSKLSWTLFLVFSWSYWDLSFALSARTSWRIMSIVPLQEVRICIDLPWNLLLWKRSSSISYSAYVLNYLFLFSFFCIMRSRLNVYAKFSKKLVKTRFGFSVYVRISLWSMNHLWM